MSVFNFLLDLTRLWIRFLRSIECLFYPLYILPLLIYQLWCWWDGSNPLDGLSPLEIMNWRIVRRASIAWRFVAQYGQEGENLHSSDLATLGPNPHRGARDDINIQWNRFAEMLLPDLSCEKRGNSWFQHRGKYFMERLEANKPPKFVKGVCYTCTNELCSHIIANFKLETSPDSNSCFCGASQFQYKIPYGGIMIRNMFVTHSEKTRVLVKEGLEFVVFDESATFKPEIPRFVNALTYQSFILDWNVFYETLYSIGASSYDIFKGKDAYHNFNSKNKPEWTYHLSNSIGLAAYYRSVSGGNWLDAKVLNVYPSPFLFPDDPFSSVLVLEPLDVCLGVSKKELIDTVDNLITLEDSLRMPPEPEPSPGIKDTLISDQVLDIMERHGAVTVEERKSAEEPIIKIIKHFTDHPSVQSMAEPILTLTDMVFNPMSSPSSLFDDKPPLLSKLSPSDHLIPVESDKFHIMESRPRFTKKNSDSDNEKGNIPVVEVLERRTEQADPASTPSVLLPLNGGDPVVKEGPLPPASSAASMTFCVALLKGVKVVPNRSSLESEIKDQSVDAEDLPNIGNVREVAKTKHADARVRKGGVAYGLIYGSPGIVFDNTPKAIENGISCRLNSKKPPPFVLKGKQRREFETFLRKVVPTLNITLPSVKLLEEWGWVSNAIVNMKPESRRRILELVRRIVSDGSWEWANDKRNKTKWFLKGDELLFKGKPRIITFVPSIVWLRFFVLIDKIIFALKYGGHVEYTPDWKSSDSVKLEFPGLSFEHLGEILDVYWASGATQTALGRYMSRAMDHHSSTGRDFCFVCGDDNTGPEGAWDASMYDSTQGSDFYDLQTLFIGLLIKPGTKGERDNRSEWKELAVGLKQWHRGPRETKFKKYDQKNMSLPTGGPHTLFFNTIGIILLKLRSWHLRFERSGLSPVDSTWAAAEQLGLKLTFTPHLNINQIPGNGGEFLKGVFSYVQNQWRWTPLDGLCKTGKKIIRDLENPKNVPSGANMEAHIKGIASGWKSYSTLLPLRMAHLSVWYDDKVKTVNPDWQNILQDSTLDREFMSSPGWLTWTEEFYQRRYDISGPNLRLMIGQIIKNKRQFAHFQGDLWDSLIRVDYRSESGSPSE